jgi:hypothetical protein
MARQESDREDLLREATALVERIELAPLQAADADPIVAGFRRDGALSVYFGADPAYQFNAAGELRRAFVTDLLYKAAEGRLVSLKRVRTTTEVQLQTRTLTTTEHTEFISLMCERLQGLARQLHAGEIKVIGQVPEGADALGRVVKWLREHEEFRVAASPRAR